MGRGVVATSLAGFVQQLAVGYLARGYYFYVTGVVPPHKDPARVDAKLCGRYGVGRSKWARARRRAAGHASHAYLRLGHLFILLATHGESPFFADEGGRVRDARRTPVRVGGYAVSVRGGRVHVRIDQQRYLELKAYLVGIATRRATGTMIAELQVALDFEPYAPVRSQCLSILRAVNRARAAAGLEPVPNCLRSRRQIVRPFEPAPGNADE